MSGVFSQISKIQSAKSLHTSYDEWYMRVLLYLHSNWFDSNNVCIDLVLEAGRIFGAPLSGLSISIHVPLSNH
jgi:hypothetical protein